MESAENYKLLFYSSPLPIVIYDMETLEIVNVNQMATDLYGYSREEFLSMTINDMRPPEEIPLIVDAVNKYVFNSEIKNLGTWNHFKKNGQHIKIEVIGHSINYKKRKCMIVVCNDVTDKKNALRALQISNERFEYATKATSDIIWDWNLETNQVYYSGNFKNLFGHKPGIHSDNLPFYFEHVHPDDRERVVLYPDQVKYGTMINWTQEYRFKKANGEYAFVLDKGIVIRDEKGIGVRMIGAMQDITLIKQNELRITRQNEQLLEIAEINAHEIRRPVATILGLVQLFNKETVENKELLKHLETATLELDKVIRRIIDKTSS
jgi:PAS domain S-box-containing protein